MPNAAHNHDRADPASAGADSADPAATAVPVAAGPGPVPETWHLTLAYDGTDFHGWQIQPDQRTVQEELQQRLRLLFRQPELRLGATSRTDAGVHALDQHVSFAVPPGSEFEPDGVRRTLNRWLPPDIQVLAAERAPPEFHARHSARGKAYTYVLHAGEKCSPLFTRFAWHCPRRLDLEAMRRAAGFLEGEHDFASFAVNPKREIDSTVRRVHRVEILPAGDLLCFSVVGESFLYKMVRSIVGYLVHVGKGNAAAAATPAVLAARNRCAAADCAPATGLFLARVFFAAEAWREYRPLIPPFAWQESPPTAGPAA